MQILVTIDHAGELAEGLWSASISPDNVRQLGMPAAEVGCKSVILLDRPGYDLDRRQLSFPMNAARVLTLGSTPAAIFVAAGEDRLSVTAAGAKGDDNTAAPAEPPRLGLGDRQLIGATSTFPNDMKEAACRVVEHVRGLDPSGDFQREKNRYVNRRDNFVAIEPQTRNKQLLINIRGRVPTQLQTLSTFNGYTAFKLANADDLPHVLAAINSATRKRY